MSHNIAVQLRLLRLVVLLMTSNMLRNLQDDLSPSKRLKKTEEKALGWKDHEAMVEDIVSKWSSMQAKEQEIKLKAAEKELQEAKDKATRVDAENQLLKQQLEASRAEARMQAEERKEMKDRLEAAADEARRKEQKAKRKAETEMAKAQSAQEARGEAVEAQQLAEAAAQEAETQAREAKTLAREARKEAKRQAKLARRQEIMAKQARDEAAEKAEDMQKMELKLTVAEKEAKEAQEERRKAVKEKAKAEKAKLQADREAEEAAVKFDFMKSIANTYEGLTYEVLKVRKLNPSQKLLKRNASFIASLPTDLKAQEHCVRKVFHSCKKKVIKLIERDGLKPANCKYCLGAAGWEEHDHGWFGDHSKGVYVSKHADYTFKYMKHNQEPPKAGDEGEVIMLELVTGRIRHFHQVDEGALPTDG